MAENWWMILKDVVFLIDGKKPEKGVEIWVCVSERTVMLNEKVGRVKARPAEDGDRHGSRKASG